MSNEIKKDSILDTLSERINNIKEQLTEVQSEITEYEGIKEAVIYDISYQKSERDAAKMEADRLFEDARICTGGYREFAASYRADAMAYMEQVRDMKELLADSYDRLDGIKMALRSLNEKKKSLKEELGSLIRQHKERIQQLKEQNAMNWREKQCTVCSRMLRYKTTWKHIPNICPECKEKFRLERERTK